jgi:hypothetical protein
MAVRQEPVLVHLGDGLVLQGEQACGVGLLERARAGAGGFHNTPLPEGHTVDAR